MQSMPRSFTEEKVLKWWSANFNTYAVYGV